MTEDGHEIDEAYTNESDPEPATERKTAPQTPYTMRDVGVGAVIALVGILLVFVVPHLLT
jgi:hypothetical protein